MNIKNYKNIFLFCTTIVMLAITGCEKNDGPIKEEYLSLIEDVPVIMTTIDPTGSQAIDMLNKSSFSGKFTVDEYFKGSKQPEKVDIVVSKNGQKGGNVKVYKSGITSYPSAHTITVADIETLFGAPVALGDNYDFSVDIYANGKKYEAFPAVGIGTGSGPLGMPGFSNTARFGAICAYNPAFYEGDFEVVKDEFEEIPVGATVKLTRISNTSFSFMYPAPGALPIVVTVNPLNNVTSVAKQVYTPTGWSWGTQYGAFSVESVASPDNIASPCDPSFSVRLKHTVGAGSFGDFTIKLKKK